MRGKFIVLYGINNLGKSTQVKLLVEKLNNAGIKTEYLKYPIYELEPTGPAINAILRDKGQHMSEIEFQKLYAQNRIDYQPELLKKLESGITVVAEDYTGTGIAWGMAKGATLDELEEINKTLIQEDLALWLTGKRFLEAKEQGHIHESNDELMERCAKTHAELAERYGWKKINANQSIEQVTADIWQTVEEMIS